MMTAKEVREAIEANQRTAEEQLEICRNRIMDTIRNAIENNESEAVCHFGIPLDIQRELIENGFFLLHFLEGKGYHGYIIRWDKPSGGRGEYVGNQFRTTGDW